MRVLAGLATLVAAALLGLVAAHWVWALLAPPPLHILPAPPEDPAAVIASVRLFGSPGPVEAASAITMGDTLGDIRLLGVIAARDGRGNALFRVPSGALYVRTGEEILPGVELRGVSPDAVTVHDAAGDHRLALPALGQGGGAPEGRTRNAATPAVAQQPPATPRSAERGRNVPARATACEPPPGFSGDVVRLNVELVGGLIAQPDVWRSMVVPDRGALVVRQTAGFAQMVGLQQGDRLEQANGIALKVPDDIVGAVLRPLASNQPVHLVGERRGKRRELYVINVGCVR
jgi:type II secretion system (T2SS) protein C